MHKTISELTRGRNRIELLDKMLKRGKVYTIETATFDDRGRQTTVPAKYTLAGIYPHHAVFRRRLPNGHELIYSFTKAELTNMILGDGA